ncbi:GNA1162 family protein [Thiomicrolovo sp. ZZH C-3]
MKYGKIAALAASIFAAMIMTGCAAHNAGITKGEAFPQMYEEEPRSILVLPAMNESTDAEAKAYYATTIEMPIAQTGYYVFPMEMVSDVLKQEGVYDTELLYSMSADKFYDYFGADVVMYTRIKAWDVSYMVLASSLTVTIESEAYSTKTNEKLWDYDGSVTVDLTSNSGGGGLAGLLVQAIGTAINTAAADYVEYAHVANARLFFALPAGPYHPAHQTDQGVVIRKR